MRLLLWFSVVTSFIAAIFIAGLVGLGLWLIFWLIFWGLARKRHPREKSVVTPEQTAARERRAQARLAKNLETQRQWDAMKARRADRKGDL